MRDAADAIALGQLYVCETGTLGVYTPGVSESEGELVRGLPRRLLPSGCADPRVLGSLVYAETFNREIVRFLKEHKP